MFAQPQSEHRGLEKMLGEWTAEAECRMGPDQPAMKSSNQMICRPVGGLWIVAESEGESPECGAWKTVMTLGYDPETKRYVGTFVGSMMTHLWIYSGQFDESGRRLVLNTEGPRFNQPGTAKYQDIVEWINDDHFILSSQILGEDGTWQPFMTSHYRRETSEPGKESHREIHATYL